MSVFKFFVLAIVCIGTAVAVNPGFRLALTSKGLDYITQTGIPILEQELSTLNIPDISGSAGTPVGSIDYDLKNIHLSNLKIPTASLKSGTSGLAVHLGSVSISGKADWHYREHSWPHISDSGSVDISVSDVSVTISAVSGSDTQGHPTLKTTGCSLSIGSLHVDFHGGASWLYNLFDDTIANSLKSSLQSQLCTAATGAINTEANHALETLPIVEKVDDISEVNYALTQAPVFTTTYVETLHKGEFFLIAKPTEAPFSAPDMPEITNTDKMMYVWITEYLVNTAGYVYQESGTLVYNVTADEVPSSFPIKLNTDSFKLFLPQLYKMYPDMPMQLELISTKPPTLTITPDMVNLTISGIMKVDVVKPDKTIVNAFVIDLTVYTEAHVSIHSNGTNQVVSGNLTLIKFEMSLASTNIGSFSLNVLQTTVNGVVNVFVIPLANKYANKGIVIPMFDGITFISPQLTLGQGYLMVSSDINYKPSYW